MEQRENKQHGGGNGFIFGVIVGVLVALLFTTKKGREILRDVSEKIITKLSSMEEYAKQADDISELFDEIDTDEKDYVKSDPQAAAEVQKEEPKVVVKEVSKKPAVAEVKKEAPKPVAKPAPAAKVEELEEDTEESVAERIEALGESEEKAPEKVITGRRWFRGLKKK